MDRNDDLSWCAGFFDMRGTFGFSIGAPWVNVINTNPIAVTRFSSCMRKYDVIFEITERSKPGKSSKKRRWDMLLKGNHVHKFAQLMQPYILAKDMQLNLVLNFYDESIPVRRRATDQEYDELMKCFNLSQYKVIKDEKRLLERLGDFPVLVQYVVHITEAESLKRWLINNISYIAGVIDAESKIALNKMEKTRDRFSPIVSITSTNKKLVEIYWSTLLNSGIGSHVGFNISDKRNLGRWTITVSGIKRIISLSQLLQNKLHVKNRQIDLMTQYCSARLQDLIGLSDLGESFKESIDVLNKED